MKMTKIAYEMNDLKRILVLVLFAIPMIASMNINCSGRAFHCVNSTHFMICVDLGGGISTTIDDFVIPCPATTVCHENNIFECDFPEVITPPPLQVIGVYKQSDTSEPTTVTNSATPTSDLFSVLKENITATTLPVSEYVTPVVKFEVLKNIKDPVGVNSANSTETSLIVTSIDSGHEFVNDNQATNKTITTSVTDSYKNLEPAVETSIHKTVNTSSTDSSKFMEKVTSVIGLINLISTDPPSIVSTKPSLGVLTTLDSLYDNVATTTEQYTYITKEVTIHSVKVKNAINSSNTPTEIDFTESFVIPEVVSTTPVVTTYNSNNTIQYINKTDSDNQRIAEKNIFIESNNTTEFVPETKTTYVASVQQVDISEPVTIVPNPQTTTDRAFVPSGLVDLITADPKRSEQSPNDYKDTFNINAVTTTTDQYTTKLETTLSEKPVTAEVKSTTPVINVVVQNVLNSEISNNSFAEFNSTGEITTAENVPAINYYISDFVTVASLPTATEKSFAPITTDANIVNTTETVTNVTISEALFNSESRLENQTIVTQPLQIIIATESTTVVTDNLYQINGELSQTLITTKNTTVSTTNITEKEKTGLFVSNTEIINEKSTEPTVTSSTATKYSAIETTTALNAFSSSALEVTSDTPVINISSSVNEPYSKNDKNNTLLFETTDTLNTIKMDQAVFKASSTDIIDSKHTEPTLSTRATITPLKVETPTATTLQNDFTTQAIKTYNELSATNAPSSFNEPILLYYATTDPVTNTTDWISQSDLATDSHTSENKIPELQNLPVNMGTSLFQHIVNTEKPGQTMTYWSTIESSVTTPVPSDVTENSNLSHIANVIIQDNISTTDVLKPKSHGAPLTVSLVPEPATITHKTVQTIPIDTDSTPGNKIETSTTYPEDVTHTTNAEFVPNILTTILPTQESTTQIITTVKQLNTSNSPIESVSTSFDSAGHDVPWKDSVNLDMLSSKVDLNEGVNKTLNQIEIKNKDSATSSAINNKDESIKITSVLEIVNSSGNLRPTGTTQQSSPIPSLSNDYIKTTTSQDSGAYVTEADNVPDYTLVQVAESVSWKIPEVTVAYPETKIINSVSSTLSTLAIVDVSTEKVKYVSTKAPISSTIDFKYTDPTKTLVDYVTEKTNDYLSTEATLTQLNKFPNVQAKTTLSSAKSVDSVITPDGSTIPLYDEVTTIKDGAFIMSSTVAPDSNIKTRIESPLLTSTVVVPEIIKNNEEPSLLTSAVPVAQMTTETINTNKVFSQTTPLAVTVETDQDVFTERNATDFTQSVLLTVKNNNYYQPMPSLPTVGASTAQITTVPTHTANIFVETVPVAAISETNQEVVTGIKSTMPNVLSTDSSDTPISMPTLPVARVTAEQIITTEPTFTMNTFAQTTPLAPAGKMNQDVLPGIKTPDLPQFVISTSNNNTPLSMPSIATVRVTAAQMTTEPVHTTLVQTTPLPAIGEKNQYILTGIKSTDVPQYVTTVKNDGPQPLPSSAIAEVTAPQSTTEPTLTITFAQTTPSLASAGKTKQDVPSEIKNTDLPKYITSTVTSNTPQSIGEITTEIIIDSLTAPDSMVETISVNGGNISETHLRETMSIDVMSNNPIVNNLKTVKNITDHESIVIGTAPKTVKSVDMNKIEVVNHTESNWIGSDVNIDNVKMKESGKAEEGKEEEEDSKPIVTKSGTDVQNKILASNSSKITTTEPKNATLDKIETRLTDTIVYKEADLKEASPPNETHSITIITKEKKAEIINANTEITDVKKYQVQIDSKNISDSYKKNNTNANITASHHYLSRQDTTISDELEQHLLSTNHTITTEVQSHLNESDKQSNKTSDEPLPLHVASIHNKNLTSKTVNASSNDTSTITVTASVFNCTNHTRGKYADKNDCRKFYTCISNLQPILGTCPNNTVFSEINKQCTRNLSHCVRNNQFQCLFEGRFSDFFKDNIYYICVKNRIHGFIRYTLQCQADYHLNKDSVKCEKNEEISMQSASSISETNNESKPKLEKIVSTDDFECENEGKFPYAKDCSKYYVCTKVKNVFRRKIKKCASDEVFDKNKKKCVESDSGEC